jgi:hypothetical protein
MRLFIDVIGWIGSFEVILAYFLISNGRLDAGSTFYQWLNLTGAVFLIINTIYYGSYPSTFINVVWVVIAIQALVKHYRKRWVQN